MSDMNQYTQLLNFLRSVNIDTFVINQLILTEIWPNQLPLFLQSISTALSLCSPTTTTNLTITIMTLSHFTATLKIHKRCLSS
ncbi:hypothetical protein CISIN_1g034831mg [Citrus sinensis]|uniref:Uncharacterized protein n=1 Tax=Citrus sinensis TaxID=2711 RepID=A0A067GPW6_CITSI|nr:hypothetical protein CISIN_1g034831mg [Citrus sinensis]